MARKSRKNIGLAPPRETATPIFSIGAYIRLSAVDKKQKGDSIETQQAIIEAFIAERPDMELREAYIDNGLSGQSFERPAFQRMIADMERGKINCCVTKDLSRLGRNAIDTGYYIEKYFPMRGVRFIAITDGYDSASERGSAGSGSIMVSLKNMVNEAYALDIGRKIRATKQMNIRAGCFVGRFPPYGFLKDPADNHKLIPDPETAPVVRTMYQMAADGTGVNVIAKWLNNNGILPPRRYFHSKGLATDKEADGSVHWSKGVIYAILKNRIYCGDMVQGKYKTQSHVQEKLPQSEWVITENTHEAVVGRELFARVQRLWEKRDKTHQSRYSAPDTKNILLRKVFCGHCGHTMFRRRSSETQHSFYCNTRQMYDKGDCKLVSVNETALKEMIVAMLQKQAGKIIGGNAPSGDSVQPGNEYMDELRNVQAEIDRNSRYLKGLYETYVNRAITGDEFKEMKLSYEAKIAALTEKEKRLRDASYDRIRQQTALEQASMDMRSVLCASDLTADAVDTLIERIRIFEDKSIKVKFTFIDEELSGGEAA
jgi:DNA invertase Pin-like site-specific DNA recombinase